MLVTMSAISHRARIVGLTRSMNITSLVARRSPPLNRRGRGGWRQTDVAKQARCRRRNPRPKRLGRPWSPDAPIAECGARRAPTQKNART